MTFSRIKSVGWLVEVSAHMRVDCQIIAQSADAVPITDLSEWVCHSFCALGAPIFRYYESYSRPYGKVISPNGLNGVPQAAKRSLPTERPFSPDQTRHLCRTTSPPPLTHGISPPPAIVLSSFMVLSIITSRLFNNLPMPALVWTDAANDTLISQYLNVFLNALR